MDEGKTISLNLPAIGAPLPMADQVADFILFTQDLRIWMSRETKVTDKPGETYSVSGTSGIKENGATVTRLSPKNYYIHQSMKYALVNNKNMEIVFYGSISNKKKVNESFNESFGKSIKGLVSEMVEKTPFEGE